MAAIEHTINRLSMKKHITVFAFLTFIIISCKKNSVDNGITPTPLLLKKFIILDSVQTAPSDTLYIYNYSYDNLNRCTQIRFNDFQNNSIGYTYNYYFGADTLISSRRLINQVYSDSVIEYFTYTTNGQMLSDSVLKYNSSALHTFVYKYQSTNNSITSVITSNGQPLIIGKYLVTKDISGNPISEKDSSLRYYLGNYYYSSSSNIFSTYDQTYCPFYKLYPKRLVEVDYELFAVDDVPFYDFLQKNNTKTKLITTLPITSGLRSANETFQYIYNPNNYPVSVIYKDLLFGDIYKGIYSY